MLRRLDYTHTRETHVSTQIDCVRRKEKKWILIEWWFVDITWWKELIMSRFDEHCKTGHCMLKVYILDHMAYYPERWEAFKFIMEPRSDDMMLSQKCHGCTSRQRLSDMRNQWNLFKYSTLWRTEYRFSKRNSVEMIIVGGNLITCRWPSMTNTMGVHQSGATEKCKRKYLREAGRKTPLRLVK